MSRVEVFRTVEHTSDRLDTITTKAETTHREPNVKLAPYWEILSPPYL